MSEPFYEGEIVDLVEMLDAREGRANQQKNILNQCPSATLLSVTMNIPGPIKNSRELEEVFLIMVEDIRKSLKDFFILETHYFSRKTGLEFFLLSEISPELLKQKMIAIEENHRFGRLMDLDVLWQENGEMKTISREKLEFPRRKCLICDKDAKVCGRARTHTIEEMQQKIVAVIQAGKG